MSESDNPILADLRAENAELDAVVAALDSEQWATPTPAEGWTIAHQIAHLTWTDAKAHRAVTAPDEFREDVRTATIPLGDAVDAGAAEGARQDPRELLERWRTGRADLQRALTSAPADLRVPWFGPPMKVPSMATARIMEIWAHGQDVFDALGLHREPTARLRNVAHLGVRTLGFAFALHDLPVPADPVRVELTAPDGGLWTWGPPDAPNRVTGPALDFCLLVTQRRHRDDLAVTATGTTAEQWLPIAQAFAGAPGSGRPSEVS
ncbi:TIGR03084 family metal-binding protein [Saccharopolyspora sp. WRP15-2]|uniref:TIGR03084 family metal-binding protein n=2 Tax=Saccharopolyspora TaxID=1835 RepID=A0ABT4V8Z8_9PSEU|nr:TIGR03084 family metal-binding protein [Saccharopolyspora oryzae]MDA3630439.1 TIGR03084 family metal-binding protein [Saccharopolyspora oryzae]